MIRTICFRSCARVWIVVLFVALAIGVNQGCLLTTTDTTDNVHDSSSVVEHAPAEEIWRALSHAIEAGTIDTTTRLAQFITVLARNGELSLDDVKRFEAAFPSITHEDRSLTSKDVELLRSLK